MTISKNVINPPKMSSITPHLSPEQAARLPWPDILALFSLRSVRELERDLDLPAGTIARAWSGERGLSSKVYQGLLEGLAARFPDSPSMRAWVKQHWPPGLLSAAGPALENLYTKLDQAIPQIGVFPTDYIERAEQSQLLDLLLNDRAAQVIWVTGPGGTGKSTLAFSLARRHWPELRTSFDHILWVNGESGDYQDGLRQIAEQLQLPESNHYESKIRHKASQSRFLLLMDTLHQTDERQRWLQLIGAQGKLVVASRTRLAESELRADGSLRQITLGGFSLAQSRTFLKNNNPAIDTLHEKTGGLPLALRIVSGLLLELHCPADQLVHYLDEATIPTLDYPPGVDTRQANLRVCFDITYQSLAEKHPQAAAYFLVAGIFQTRTILKSLLDEAAETKGDHLLGVLLRYNLAEPLTLRGERFVQLHPLVYEFAREKIAASEHFTTLEKRYTEAIYEETFRVYYDTANGFSRLLPQIHKQDIFHVLELKIQLGHWNWVAYFFLAAFDVFLAHSPIGEKPFALLSLLENQLPHEDSPIIELLRAAILRRKLYQAILNPNLEYQQSLITQARAILDRLNLPAGWEDFYQNERQAILDEQARLLIDNQQSGLLESLLPAENKTTDNIYAQAKTLKNNGEYEKARDVLSALLETDNPGFRYRAERWLPALALAECHEELGEYAQATALYQQIFEETENNPVPIFRAEFGRSLALCLKMQKRFAEMLPILDAIDQVIAEQDEPYYQLMQFYTWKYRAQASQALNDRNGALTFGQKALSQAEAIANTGLIESIQDFLAKLKE